MASDVTRLRCGQRVGTRGSIALAVHVGFARRGRRTSATPEFTGWTRNGGFAEYIAASIFVYPIPDGFGDVEPTPLLCAGVIGYRALRLMDIHDWKGADQLGIYGFGAAGHVCIQIAKARGADVYVMTPDKSRHQALAEELGSSLGQTLTNDRRRSSMARSYLLRRVTSFHRPSKHWTKARHLSWAAYT